MAQDKPKGFFDHPAKNYLNEVAEYLGARGLSVKDFDIVYYHQKNHNVYQKLNGAMFALPLEGWAFRVKDSYGDVLEGGLLFRPCNWPEGTVYTKDDDEQYIPLQSKPKFIQVGGWRIHWTSSAQEIMNSAHVMIHEKFTCAALSAKHLGYPSIGMSGCGNWSHKRTMIPELRRAISGMLPQATLYICLDGDVLSNPDVNSAARSLYGWVQGLRPDIQVVFPQVPQGYGGWDDWAAAQEDVQGAWIVELSRQGLDITAHLPADLLIEHYGLGAKVDKNGRILMLHTSTNYFRLLSQHPKWADYVVNTNNQMYQIDNPAAPLDAEDLARRTEFWLTENVFTGVEAERVSYSSALRAGKELMALPERKQSLAHHHIDQLGGPVEQAEALAAIRRLFTQGLRVTGPMTQEEFEVTMLRVFRDMVGMWSWDYEWSPQWMLCLVGPSGSGKSDFSRSLLRTLRARGFLSSVGRIHTAGDKAKPEEMARVLNGALIGVLDEYNPPANLGQAKQYEDQLLSIIGERFTNLRRMRQDDPKPILRTASVVLTTTDKNKRFLRSGKGEGIERRAIVLEVVGHVQWGDVLTSDRGVISECGDVLLRWGLHAYRTGCCKGDATEFSTKYAARYLDDDDGLRNVGKTWAKGGFEDRITRLKDVLYRKSSGDWRFSPTQLLEIFCPMETRVTRDQATKLNNLAIECGAVEWGKARVFGLDGKERQVDRAYVVKDWDAWTTAMGSALGI